MWNWDWTSPWLYLGAACVLAAIVGGGITALGYTIPILHSRLRQALLAIFGIVLIVVPQVVQSIDANNKQKEAQRIAEQQERDKLKITAVWAHVDPPYYWGCSVPVKWTGAVTATGKTGKIVVTTQPMYTELHPEVDPAHQNVYDNADDPHDYPIDSSGDLPQSGTIKITVHNPGLVNYQFVLRVLAPTKMESDPAPFTIECNQGTPQ
jgi:hypothetical protein